ncbi:sodium-dependent transporter [Flammeovirgaceae bacterium SG7u.111]|nr:sodium-dependent transporter [Flammeovirgaceae bacterium SG7u.132]WPO35176.1 sodium-dependent transporter [Flammeovirgaceae bacterium SG7u.111]
MALRSGFSSRLGFVAAASGSAVGLGNIWAFPYITGENGGAAFLLIYICCTFLIGFPIMVGEIAVGRKAKANPYGAYKLLGGKRWSVVGLLGILCGIMILSFYNVVAGWAFGYFIQIGFGDLLAQGDFGSFFGGYVADYSDNLVYSFVFMVLTAIIVIGGVKQGIELAAKILMPFLFIILFGLIIYAMTLDNAMDGLAFYLKPDFSLVNAKTIYSAFGQAFFSLSLGMGALITYGSYISKNENIISAAAIVTVADVLVAFLAGLLIFPLVFSQGQDPTEGPGLVFVVLPGVFQQIGPIAGRVIGGGFFLLLCMAALTSTISLLEVPVAYFVDQKKWPRKLVVAGLAAVVFSIGLLSMLSQGAVDGLTNFLFYEGKSQTFLDFISHVFLDVSLPLGGFLLSIFVAYKLKTKNLSEEIAHGNSGYVGSNIEKFINFSLTVLCPIALGIIFVVTVLQKFGNVHIF